MGSIKGVIAGNFDVIHPGYIRMFREAKQHCDHLVVMLHKDPSIERPEKIKPILDVWDRTNILSSLRFVDLTGIMFDRYWDFYSTKSVSVLI